LNKLYLIENLTDTENHQPGKIGEKLIILKLWTKFI